MTYELAKELKDAGFPQGLPRGLNDVYFPTLSEIIEACGDRFVKLEKSTRQTGEREISDCWVAMGLLQEPKEYIARQGATPEESVARLWLLLNKKEV